MARLKNALLLEAKEGFRGNRLKFALLCLCFVILSIQFLNQYDATSGVVDGAIVPLSDRGRFTAGDVFFSFFHGVRVETVAAEGQFAFPIGWFALQVVIAAIVGHYPVRHDGYDYQLTLRTGNRTIIGLCRLFWIILAILAAFILAVVVSMCTALLAGELTFNLSPSILSALYGAPVMMGDPCQIVLFFCTPLVGLLAVSIAQAFVAGVAEPIIGILSVIIYDVASVYVDSVLFVSGRTMLLRCGCLNDPLPILFGSYLPCIACFVVFSVLFIALFKKSDFLNADKESR